MLRHKLVPIALLLVLAAPSFGSAATLSGPRAEEPEGPLAAALSELRELVTMLWARPADHGTVTAAAEGSGGAGGPGGEGGGSYDPNGAGDEVPEPAEGLRTPSPAPAG